MNRSSNINMYEGLASYFLPTGVLEYFEVTDFAEVPTLDAEVLYTTELHIYLKELVRLPEQGRDARMRHRPPRSDKSEMDSIAD